MIQNYFRNCFLSLNINNFYFYQPNGPIITKDIEPNEISGGFKAIPGEWSAWDFIEINGSKTCKELTEYLKQKYDINVDTILIDTYTIYDTLFLLANAELKIEDVYENIMKDKTKEKTSYLLLNIIGKITETKIGEKTYKNVSVSLPKIKYKFK